MDVNTSNKTGSVSLEIEATRSFEHQTETDPKCLDDNLTSIGRNINEIKYLVNNNVKNSMGRSPLHHAAEFGKLEAAELLIAHGADINCLDNDGNTCLHRAAIGGHINTVNYFIHNNVNLRNNLGKTPLHIAAEFGNLEAMEILIANGAERTCLDTNNNTCSHRAAIGGNLKIIEYFLEITKINARNNHGRTALHIAAELGRLNAVKYLIECGAELKCLDYSGNTCLHRAAIGGNITTIEYFLQSTKENVKNASGRTPLHNAAEFGNLEAAKFLIDNGAEPDYLDNDGNSCLHRAAIGGNIKTIEYFLQDYDVNIKNGFGRTPLHNSAEFGKLEAAKFLIDNGADPECLDDGDHTCLHRAAMGAYLNTIEHFLQYHDVNVKNSFGRTPLHKAAEFGRVEAANFLISKKADPSCLDRNGNSCLHFAAVGGHINSIEYFLQYNNVNLKNNYDKTPLSFAEEFRKVEATTFLNDYKADSKGLYTGTFLQDGKIAVRNYLGRTFLHYAAHFGKLEMIAIFVIIIIIIIFIPNMLK